MDAATLLREGRPAEALAALTETVRREPSEARHRVFLFQLLAILGQWERALNQLQMAAQLDPGALAMAQTYREAVRAESYRGEVFEGRRTPTVFGDPAEWAAAMVEALRLDAVDGPGAGQGLRERALEEAPAVPGELNGRAFAWIADADMRTGPMLEVIVQGRYLWVPFERIARMVVEEPADLRDLVWMPAWFTWTNGGEAPGLVPTRYPGTAERSGQGETGGALCLSRRTEWVEAAPGLYHGLGQRLLGTDAGELGLLEVRELTMKPVGGNG